MNINFSIDDKHTVNFVHDYTTELTINAKCIDHLRNSCPSVTFNEINEVDVGECRLRVSM